VILKGEEVITVSQNGLEIADKGRVSNSVAMLRKCVDLAKKRKQIVEQALSDSS
jgi:hypothetical protein